LNQSRNIVHFHEGIEMKKYVIMGLTAIVAVAIAKRMPVVQDYL